MIKYINYFFAFIIILICLIAGIYFGRYMYGMLNPYGSIHLHPTVIMLLSVIISLIVGTLLASPFYITACIVDIRDISQKMLIAMNSNPTCQPIETNDSNESIDKNDEIESPKLHEDDDSTEQKDIKNLLEANEQTNKENNEDEILTFYNKNKYMVDTIYKYINIKSDESQREEIINEFNSELLESNLSKSDYINLLLDNRRFTISKIDGYSDDLQQQDELNKRLNKLNLQIHYLFESYITN